MMSMIYRMLFDSRYPINSKHKIGEMKVGNNLYDEFQDIRSESKNKSLISLFECEKQYCKLLREYKEEIDYIYGRLKGIRAPKRATTLRYKS
jgi:hypothetical protein